MPNGWRGYLIKGRDIGWPTIGQGAPPRPPCQHQQQMMGSIMDIPVYWAHNSKRIGKHCGSRRTQPIGNS
eukprot:9760843-Karenia_brevis.AAC.1